MEEENQRLLLEKLENRVNNLMTDMNKLKRKNIRIPNYFSKEKYYFVVKYNFTPIKTEYFHERDESKLK
jgi:hypothetical protein